MKPRLKETQAAEYLGLSWKSLRSARFKNRGPRCVMINGRAYYSESDLDEFLANATLEPSSEKMGRLKKEASTKETEFTSSTE